MQRYHEPSFTTNQSERRQRLNSQNEPLAAMTLPSSLNHTANPAVEKHLPFLDALRGYAIIGVFIAHFAHYFSIGLPPYLRFCGYGVTLFYVLSAYCLMLSFRRHSKAPDWLSYSIRRFFRIAPAFYLAVALWSLLRLQTNEVTDPGNVATSLTFINGAFPRYIQSAIPHGWSIAIETSFYLILPYLFLHIRSLRKSLLFIGITTPFCVAVSWALPFAVNWANPNEPFQKLADYTVYWLPAQLPVFLTGISTFYIVYGTCGTSAYIRSLFKTKPMIPLALIAISAISAGYLPTRIAHLVVAGGCAFWIVLLASHPRTNFYNVAVAKIGAISFSGYLFHQVAINAFLPLARSGSDWKQLGIAFLGTAASALILAFLGFHLVEKPGVALGSKLIKSLQTKIAA